MEYPTLTVDLIDSGAISLLRDMERLNLIRVNPPERTAGALRLPPKGSLSERFAGALHLSAEKYAAFQTTLQEGRAEWERDIYWIPTSSSDTSPV
jgi:hypothetical protein